MKFFNRSAVVLLPRYCSVDRISTPCATNKPIARCSIAQGHGVGHVCLDFEGMCAAGGGGLDDLQRAIERLVVVARHLGDDEGAVIPADESAADVDGLVHG